jgi:hypothetical protein
MKEFIQEVGIFIWYLFTEPIRFVKEITRKTLKKTLKQSTILVIYFSAVLFFLKTDIIYMKFGLMLLLLIGILRFEWMRGNFRHRYRQRYMSRFMKKEGKNGNKYNSYN